MACDQSAQSEPDTSDLCYEMANGSDQTKRMSMIAGTDLNTRIALVTGASRGIGRAIALALADAGASVAVNYRNRTPEATEVVKAVRSMGRHAIAVPADVSLGQAITDMIARIERELGPVDVLVNNAGIALTRGLDDLAEEDFDRTMATNLKSAFLCTQAVLPGMRARRWGRIVNISSGAARGAGGVGVHYNASKAGLEGLTRGYAARLAKDGITVNAVAPSLIATDMIEALGRNPASRIPIGRLGTADEVAQAVLMVLANSYMTGQTVQLNGGLHFV
jgi:3-oxoacyl-[acyl-carrier protein] reductase